MNCKRVNVALSSHGLDWPQLMYRCKIYICLSIFIFVALPSYETHARYTLSAHKLNNNNQTYKSYKNIPSSNYVQDYSESGNFHIKHSDAMLNSIYVQKLKQNLHIPESADNVNVTYNDTRQNQLLIQHADTLIHRRFKRGVIHLYNMVVCATGCNPLAYKGYGCYCGFLGSGYVIDGIDRCCKMHDWCYDATECPTLSEYFVPYYWRCYHGYKPICAVEHGNWGGSGSCAQRLCECDRSFAECLRRYPCPTTKAVCTSSPWRLVQNLFMMM